MTKTSQAQIESHLLVVDLNLLLLFLISGIMQELNGTNLSYNRKSIIRMYPVPELSNFLNKSVLFQLSHPRSCSFGVRGFRVSTKRINTNCSMRQNVFNLD